MSGSEVIVHVGIDDCDSRTYMCTTYIAALIVEKLLDLNCVFIDYPNLIRLNPGVPWKTRGNGAVALRFKCSDPDNVFNIVLSIVKEFSDSNSNYGVVMHLGTIPPEAMDFASRALWSIVSISEAFKIIRKYNMKYSCRRDCRGVVGALAAIGNTLNSDHTYELLAYRVKENIGKRIRNIDPQSVVEMDKATKPYTFNNYDYEKRRILITPRGPDPVLLGIRGESAEAVLSAFKMLRIMEPYERYIIFRSNQGTAEHLRFELNPCRLKAYTTGYIVGTIASKPEVGIGGHVYFYIESKGCRIRCAVYRPSGGLRKTALLLVPGDIVEVGGEVRKRTIKNPTVINIEYIKIISLAEDFEYRNPRCPICSRRMESMGRGQGYRCRRCKLKGLKLSRERIVKPRMVKQGLYLPSLRSMRHLSKPYQRYGLEKKYVSISLINGWFHVFS
ncbi:MAG: tRNA(Ile)(2)-agmatinylcytidine synthase [Candidatus Methanomethylicia archaeon]